MSISKVIQFEKRDKSQIEEITKLNKDIEGKDNKIKNLNKNIKTLEDNNRSLKNKNKSLEDKNQRLEKQIKNRRSTTLTRGGNGSYSHKSVFTSTFYCPYDNVSGMEHNGDANATATGRPPGPNVFAVDPRVIPLGSPMRVTYPSGEVRVGVAGDTGGLIKGNIIDTFVYTNREAERRGRERVIVEW